MGKVCLRPSITNERLLAGSLHTNLFRSSFRVKVKGGKQVDYHLWEGEGISIFPQRPDSGNGN